MICKELQNILKENSGKADSIYKEISYKLLYITKVSQVNKYQLACL